jgi:hypothetical protein
MRDHCQRCQSTANDDVPRQAHAAHAVARITAIAAKSLPTVLPFPRALSMAASLSPPAITDPTTTRRDPGLHGVTPTPGPAYATLAVIASLAWTPLNWPPRAQAGAPEPNRRATPSTVTISSSTVRPPRVLFTSAATDHHHREVTFTAKAQPQAAASLPRLLPSTAKRSWQHSPNRQTAISVRPQRPGTSRPTATCARFSLPRSALRTAGGMARCATGGRWGSPGGRYYPPGETPRRTARPPDGTLREPSRAWHRHRFRTDPDHHHPLIPSLPGLAMSRIRADAPDPSPPPTAPAEPWTWYAPSRDVTGRITWVDPDSWLTTDPPDPRHRPYPQQFLPVRPETSP